MHFLDAVLALHLLITRSMPVLCHVARAALLYWKGCSLCFPLPPVNASPPAVLVLRLHGAISMAGLLNAAGGSQLQPKP